MTNRLLLHRFPVKRMNVSRTPGVFGKGTAVFTEGGVEVAIMARDTATLRKVFDKLKENPEQSLDLKLVYDVVYMQSQNVTLEDEEL